MEIPFFFQIYFHEFFNPLRRHFKIKNYSSSSPFYSWNCINSKILGGISYLKRLMMKKKLKIVEISMRKSGKCLRINFCFLPMIIKVNSRRLFILFWIRTIPRFHKSVDDENFLPLMGVNNFLQYSERVSIENAVEKVLNALKFSYKISPRKIALQKMFL